MPDTKLWLLGGLLTLAAVVVFAPAVLSGGGVAGGTGGYAGHGGMMGGYGGAMGGYGAGFGFLGPLVPLLVMLLLVGGLVALGQATLGEKGSSLAGSPDAIAELRSAYARGELTEEEFETRLARLRRNENR
jgi:putative membrane protein